MKLHIQKENQLECAWDLREGTEDLGNWAAQLSRIPVENGWEYTLKVTAKQPAGNVVITVSEVKEGWTRENYVFAPAGMYNGNRFKSLPLEYPPIAVGNVDDVPDPEPVITDVPRLSKDGESKIELMAGDLSKPLFGYFSPKNKQAFFFLFTQRSFPEQDNSIRVEEVGDTAEFALVVPGYRSKIYHFMHSDCESDDKGADMLAGESVTIRFRLYEQPCQSVTEYLAQFMDLRKEFNGPDEPVNVVPFSKAFQAVENKYNIHNWVCTERFYRSSNADSSIGSQWQTGWVGGGMSTYPCFLAGTHLSKHRSWQTLEFLFREIWMGSGLMYGIYYNGRPYGDSINPEGDKNILLLRKFTDAVYFVLKQFLLFEKEGTEIPEEWRKKLRVSLETLRDLFEVNGQFGQFVDVSSKKILVRGTSSAATGIGALALGWAYYKEGSFLETACKAGEYYFHNYLEKGFSNGGPGEICQCPDSESAFGLLESYMALYNVTGDARWLPYAEASANLAASWCVSYDFQFPAKSQFARRGIKSAGAVWASIQNKHAAPGICTLSGVSLFELYRATGKAQYLGLFREISHSITQFVSLDENPFQNTWGGTQYGMYSYEGQSGERVQLSDWEGRENVGEFPGGACWCEVSIMLNYVENPGVYVVVDQEKIFCFDHIIARTVRANNDELALELENPTQYDAVVSVFAEKSYQQKKPMPVNPWDGYQKVRVEKRGKTVIHLTK